MNATVAEFGTLDVALELFVALDLAFAFPTSTFLPDHLTTLKLENVVKNTSRGVNSMTTRAALVVCVHVYSKYDRREAESFAGMR